MNKRDFLKLTALASGISFVAPTAMALDFGKMLSAGTDLAKKPLAFDEKPYYSCVGLANRAALSAL